MPVTCQGCGYADNDEGLAYCLKCNEGLTSTGPAVWRAAPEGAQAAGAWRLVPKEGGRLLQDRVILLGSGRLMLGRFDETSGPVDIELSQLPSGDTTSRNHAVLEFAGNAWMLRDPGSTNGVFVRRAGEQRFSARITDPVPVQDGDEIGLGMLVLVLQGPGPTKEEAAPAGEGEPALRQVAEGTIASSDAVTEGGIASGNEQSGLLRGEEAGGAGSTGTEWTDEI